MPFNAQSGQYVGRLYVDEYVRDPGRYDPIACIDPTCSRPELHVVRNNVARPFFRHGHGASCSTQSGDRHVNAMSAWHREWQAECDDRERVEHGVPHGASHVSNDVFAKFGWAVEFQHSHIRQADIKNREDAMQGKVIWLVDATSDNQGVGLVSEMPRTNTLEWFTPPAYLKWIDCVVAVDTGEAIHVLPSGHRYGAAHSTYPMGQVITMTRQQFIDSWVNGDTQPPHCKLRAGFATRWHWLRSEEAAAETARREERARLRSLEIRRGLSAHAEPGSCRFSSLDHLEGDEREIEESAIELVEQMLLVEQQMSEIERLRRAASEARAAADAVRLAEREERERERLKRAFADDERRRAEAERKRQADEAKALGKVPASHRAAMGVIESTLGISSFMVVSEQEGNRLMARQAHGKPDHDESAGSCSRCADHFSNRYGDRAAGNLCPQCEGAAA